MKTLPMTQWKYIMDVSTWRKTNDKIKMIKMVKLHLLFLLWLETLLEIVLSLSKKLKWLHHLSGALIKALKALIKAFKALINRT